MSCSGENVSSKGVSYRQTFLSKFDQTPLQLKTQHKIINGDSRQMTELVNNSVHLVITSPPYWQLKDYGTDNQIGFHDTYENYINNLNLV